MNHPIHSVEDLVANEDFQNLCLEPTEELIEHWNIWRNQNPDNSKLFEEARTLVHELTLSPSSPEVEKAYADFVANRKVTTQEAKLVKVSSKRWNAKWAIAATIIILLGLGIWQWIGNNNYIQHDTPFGKLETISLSDGSVVKLNANSSIKFSESWKNSNVREVWLQGEAYFDIKDDVTEKPFIVHSSKGDIKVLGTSFNVNNRRELLNVVLLEGKVQLEIPNHQPISMKAGDIVQVNEKGLIDRPEMDSESLVAWKEEKMTFKAVPIEKIIQRFKDEFDIDVQVKEESVLKRKVTASISKNNPELLLEALSQIYDLKIQKIDTNKYLIE